MKLIVCSLFAFSTLGWSSSISLYPDSVTYMPKLGKKVTYVMVTRIQMLDGPGQERVVARLDIRTAKSRAGTNTTLTLKTGVIGQDSPELPKLAKDVANGAVLASFVRPFESRLKGIVEKTLVVDGNGKVIGAGGDLQNHFNRLGLYGRTAKVGQSWTVDDNFVPMKVEVVGIQKRNGINCVLLKSTKHFRLEKARTIDGLMLEEFQGMAWFDLSNGEVVESIGTDEKTVEVKGRGARKTRSEIHSLRVVD